MKRILKLSALFIILGFVFKSCKKQNVTDLPTVPSIIRKLAPVANAGADQTITLPADSVVLSGCGTDADGNIVSYEWIKIGGPEQYKLVNSTRAVTKLRNLVAGKYEFVLKLTDNDGLSSKDVVIVNVFSVIGSCPCAPNCDPYGDPCNPWDY